MNKQELCETVSVGSYDFELNAENNFYECRGDVMYDNEHDEIPEPGLWKAAHKLVSILQADGYKSHVSHSEKGWVEVNIQD